MAYWHIVNVEYKRCGFAKTRLRHPSLPFDRPPTLPVQSVDAYVPSVNHVKTKRKEVDHILWVWGLDFLLQSINAVSIALIEELKDTLKIDTIYDPEQSMEVKSETLPGLTSSTKPHPAEWTLLSAILILQQSMMVYSVGFGFGVCFFGFPFFSRTFSFTDLVRFTFQFFLLLNYILKTKTKT